MSSPVSARTSGFAWCAASGRPPATDERAERGPHRRVDEQRPGDPDHVAGRAVARRAPGPRGPSDPRCPPTRRPRPRRGAVLRAPRATSAAASAVVEQLDLGLEHRRLAGCGTEIGVEGGGEPVEERVELEELEQPAHLGARRWQPDRSRGRRCSCRAARRGRAPSSRRSGARSPRGRRGSRAASGVWSSRCSKIPSMPP